jgi:hypothetical protein
MQTRGASPRAAATAYGLSQHHILANFSGMFLRPTSGVVFNSSNFTKSAPPQIEAPMTLITAAIGTNICTLTDLMERI